MKKVYKLTCILLLATYACFAQDLPKGINLDKPDNLGFRKTWAVIIGISNYKSDKVPKLAHASRDAEEFKKTLVSISDQINLDTNTIQLLKDERATKNEIFKSLAYLISHVKPGDRVIFYFSGHGDAENITVDKLGYLLAYDCNPEEYFTEGTIPVALLKSYLKTCLSVKGDNGDAKQELIILDACHAGEFGAGESGRKNLSTQLGQSWEENRMVTLLSCKPGELSYENTQMGGVFTYFLNDGFRGSADLDDNGMISGTEINFHLTSKFINAGYKNQNPTVSIGNVDILPYNKERFKSMLGATPTIVKVKNATQTKGFGLEPIELEKLLGEFKSYIRKGQLVVGNKAADTIHCAKFIYEKIKLAKIDEEQFLDLQTNLVAALQYKTSENLKAYVAKGKRAQGADYSYQEAAKEMAYALKIVDSSHPVYAQIKPRAIFMKSLYLKDNEAAIIELREAQKIEPNAPYINYALGITFLAMNVPDSAITYLNKTLEVSPRWYLAYYSLGRAYKSKKEYNKAIQNLKTAIGFFPENVNSHIELGLSYEQIGEKENALKAFNQAKSLDPTNANAIALAANVNFKLDKFEKSRNLFKKQAKLTPNSAVVFQNIGITYEREANLAEALKSYEVAATKDTTKVDALLYASNIYRAQKNPEKEIIELQKALKRKPDHVLIYTKLAEVYKQLHQDSLAESWYQKALAIDAANVSANSNLGVFESRRKNYQKSLNYFYAVQKTEPNNNGNNYNIGLMLWSLQRYSQAEQAFNSAIAVDSTNAQLYFNRAAVQEKQGKIRAALLSNLKGFKLDSTKTGKLNDIAHAYFKLKTFELAAKYYSLANRTDPKQENLYNIAVSLSNAEKNDQAIPLLEQAIKLYPNYMPSYSLLAQIYSEGNQNKLALATLERAESTLGKTYEITAKRARLLQSWNNISAALSEFKQAQQLDPQKPDTYDAIAAIMLADLKDTTAAMSYFQKALSTHPKTASPALHLGAIFYDKNDLKNALKYYQLSVEADSLNAAAYEELAYVYGQMSDDDKAFKNYQKAVTLDSNATFSLVELARLYAIADKPETGLPLINRAIALDSADTHAYIAKATYFVSTPDSAIVLLEKSLSIDSLDSWAHWSLANNLFDIGAYKNAIISSTNAIKNGYDTVDAWVLIANSNIALENYKQAATAIREAEKRDPKDYDLIIAKGDLLANQGKVAEALQQYQRARTKDPQNSKAYQDIAWAYNEQGKYDLAIANYRKALRLDSTNVEIYPKIAAVQWAKKDQSAAIKGYKLAIAKAPWMMESYTQLAGVYKTLKKPEELKATLKAALLVDSTNSEITSLLGAIANKNRNYELALEYFKTAAKNAGSKDTSYAEIGIQYQFLGNTSAAKYYYQLSLSVDSTNLASNMNIGQLLTAENQLDSAKAYYLRAIKFNPDYGPGHVELGKLLNHSLSLNPRDKATIYQFMLLNVFTRKNDLALKRLKQLLDLGYQDIDTLRSDKDLAELRKQPGFEQLLKLHGH